MISRLRHILLEYNVFKCTEKEVEIAIEARSRISPDVCWRCDIQDIKRPNPLRGNNKMAGLKSNTPWLLLLRSKVSLFIKKQHLLRF